jgi:hypothetical protein
VAQSDLVRVGGKLVRRPQRGDSTAEKRFKETIKQEQKRIQKLKLKEARQKAAKDLDKQFKEAQFSNINSAISSLEEIKNKNPNIYKFMQVKPETFKKKQDKRVDTIKKRINRLKKDIEDSKKDEKRYRDRDDDEREDREEARQEGYEKEIKVLKKYLPKVKGGDLTLNINKVLDYADDVGDAEYKRERYQKEIAKKVAQGAGDVTKISYSNGKPSSAVVNGQKISLKGLSSKEKENIRLGSVKRSEIKDINKKIREGKALSVKDFKKARELGIKSSEVLSAAAKQFEIDKKLKELKEKQKSVRENQIDKSFKDAGLDFVVGAFTPKQKKKILKRFTEPVRAKVADIRTREGLSDIEREKKLRNLLNISPERVNQSKTFKDIIDKINKNKKLRSEDLIKANNLISPGTKFTATKKEQVPIYKMNATFLDKLDLAQPRARKILESYGNSLVDLTAGQLESIRKESKGTAKAALAATLGFPLALGIVAIRDLYNIVKLSNPKVRDNFVKGMIKLATDKNSQKSFLRQKDKFGKDLFEGNIFAWAEIMDMIIPIEAIGKLGKTGDFIDTTKKVQSSVKDLRKVDLTKPNEKVIKNTIDELDKLKPNQRLELLQSQGIKVKDAREANKYLKDLKDSLITEKKIKNLDNLISDANKKFKNTIKKPTQSKFDNTLSEVKSINKKVNNLKSEVKDISKIKQDLKKLDKLQKQKTTKVGDKIVTTKLTKQQEKIVKDFIKEKNDIINKINRIQRRIKSTNIDEITKNILQSEKKSYQDFIKQVKAREEIIFGDSKAPRSKKIEQVKKLGEEIKKAKKRKSIFNKLDKLQIKLKSKGFKDINLLEPTLRNRFRKVLKDVDNINNKSLAQLGSLDKRLDNLLSSQIKKSEVKGFAKKEISDVLQEARSEIKKNSKKLTKEQVNNILLKDNSKKLINDRIKNIESNIINLRKKVLSDIFFIDNFKNIPLKNTQKFNNFLSDLMKSKKLTRQERVRITNIEGLINDLDKQLNKFKSNLKNLPEKKKEVNQELFEKRLEQSKGKFNQPKVISDDVVLPFKIGDIEGEVRIINFGFGKKGSIGKLQKKPKPKVEFKFYKKTKNKYGTPIDNMQKRINQALKRDKKIQNRISVAENYKKSSKRLDDIDLRKLDEKQRKRLKRAKSTINEQIKDISKDIEFRTAFIIAKILKKDTLVDKRISLKDMLKYRTELKQINKIINEVKKDIVKPIKEPKRKKPGKIKKIKRPRKPDRPKPTKKDTEIKTRIKRPKKPKDIKIPPKKLRIPKFDSLPETKNKKRQGYIIKIKSGNRIVAKTNKVLPKRRATNLARQIVDGKKGNFPLSASYSLEKTRKTNIADVKRTILENKFRTKKTKSPKVQESVEKKKYRIDTKQEKKAIKKLRKKTKTKKTTKNNKKSKKK